MSRARIIKPEFFTSRSLSRCSISAMVTYAGLWCEADDAGRGIADADVIKGHVWPKRRDVTSDDVEKHLEELSETNHILLYSVDGERYYVVLEWEKHQSAAYRRGDPKHPAPPLHTFARGGVQDATESVLDRIGKDIKGRDRSASASGAPTPDRFEVTGALREWATKASITINLESETQKFLDHHASKGSRFKDWDRAWQKWMRQANEWAQQRTTGNKAKTVFDTERDWKSTGATGRYVSDEDWGEVIKLPGEE